MYMTRDKGSNDIDFWCNKNDFGYYKGIYDYDECCQLFVLSKEKFKQIFPNRKLPRKGSCKYVELRLYIPGEG